MQHGVMHRRSGTSLSNEEKQNPGSNAGVFVCPLKGKARASSAIEYRIRGHGCGVVVLKAREQHITAKQDDCQQAISKVGRLSGAVIAHFTGIPGLANHCSALCSRPCEFNFHAGCARACE
jgi:hypothetical protein